MKNKFNNGIRYAVLMIIVGMVMLLLPMSSLFAEEIPAGWHRVPDEGTFSPTNVTAVAPPGCDITKIMIKPGNIKSGEITANGDYGHYAEWDYTEDKPKTPVVLLIGYTFVTSGSDIDGFKWVGAYEVSGLSENSNTVTIIINTIHGNVIQNMSHVDFYYECPTPGAIQITKNVTGGLTGTFDFEVKDASGAVVDSPSITIDSSESSDSTTITGLAPGNYTVTETGGTASANFTTSPTGPIAVTVVAGQTNTDAVFTNSPEEAPETGAIQITKNVTGGLTGTFNFEVKDSAGNVVDSPSITIDSNESSDSTTITGLAPGDYTVTETGGTASASFTTSPTGSIAVTVVAGQTNSSASFRNDPSTPRLCECSLVVKKRDQHGHPIEDAVFKVDGIEKTTRGGEARWDNLECDTSYIVRELKPEEGDYSIHLDDCGERSTMRVVNKIEEGELEVLGIMEVLPYTGPAIPYSPFIGISTVLAGAVLYILSKSKKKR